jgi:ABC-type transport system involved in cytochrome bd biosynthesis fused ATPase/permease subunit
MEVRKKLFLRRLMILLRSTSMADADPLPLVIRNLSFQYRSRTEPAIHAISLELHPGD